VITSNVKVPNLETLKDVAEKYCINLKPTGIPIRNWYA
jgi:hypothetical protein